jgi:hypothetical protein
MRDARRVRDIEGAGPQAGAIEIGLDELHAIDAEPARRLDADTGKVSARCNLQRAL